MELRPLDQQKYGPSMAERSGSQAAWVRRCRHSADPSFGRKSAKSCGWLCVGLFRLESGGLVLPRIQATLPLVSRTASSASITAAPRIRVNGFDAEFLLLQLPLCRLFHTAPVPETR